jgi:hypothetical protein
VPLVQQFREAAAESCPPPTLHSFADLRPPGGDPQKRRLQLLHVPLYGGQQRRQQPGRSAGPAAKSGPESASTSPSLSIITASTSAALLGKCV